MFQPATFLLLCLFFPVRLPTSIRRYLPNCTIAIIYRTITLVVSRWLLWSDGLRQKNILRFVWRVLGLTRLLCRWRLWKSWGWFNWYRRERYILNRIRNDANQLTFLQPGNLPKYTHPLLLRLFKNTPYQQFINAYPNNANQMREIYEKEKQTFNHVGFSHFVYGSIIQI